MNEELKRQFNILIKDYINYYKKNNESKLTPNRWSTRGLIREINCKKLDCKDCEELGCRYYHTLMSATTLNKIIQGIPVTKEIYCIVINKLLYKYKVFDDIDIKLLIHNIYPVILHYRKDTLEKYLHFIDEIFIEAKEYFYYQDYYLLFKALLEFQLYGKLTDSKFVYKLLEFNTFFNSDDELLVELVCYLILMNDIMHIFNQEIQNELIIKMKILPNNGLIYYMKSIICYFSKERISSIDFIRKSYTSFLEEENQSRLFDILMWEANMYSYLESTLALEKYKSAEAILRKNEYIPDYRKNSLYYALTLYYYFNDNHDESYIYTKKQEYSYNDTKKYIHQLTSLHLYSNLNHCIDDSDLLMINNCDDINYIQLLRYFELKHKLLCESNNAILAKQATEYIFDKVKPLLHRDINNVFLKHLFKNELIYLSKFYNNKRRIIGFIDEMNIR